MAYQNNKPSPNFYLRFGKDALKMETEKARLFNVEIGGEMQNIWLPKSQTIFYSEEGDTIAVTVPEWLVKKNNLSEWADEEWIAAGCPE